MPPNHPCPLTFHLGRGPALSCYSSAGLPPTVQGMQCLQSAFHDNPEEPRRLLGGRAAGGGEVQRCWRGRKGPGWLCLPTPAVQGTTSRWLSLASPVPEMLCLSHRAFMSTPRTPRGNPMSLCVWAMLLRMGGGGRGSVQKW